MFVQLIQGRAADATALRRQFETWGRDLRSGAEGFLGSTGGVTDEGEVFVMARFESDQAARANSDRAEQGRWWEETAKHFDGDPTFVESTEVELLMGGGSDTARFVQVVQGKVSDKPRAKELMSDLGTLLQAERPSILGGVVIWHDADRFSNVIYFRSEEEARREEKQGVSETAGERLGEWRSLLDAESFLDLRDPWMTGPQA